MNTSTSLSSVGRAPGLIAEEPKSKSTPSSSTIAPLSPIETLLASPMTATTLSRICSRIDRRSTAMVCMRLRISSSSLFAALR